MTLRELAQKIQGLPEADLDLPVGIMDDSVGGYSEPKFEKWDSLKFVEYDYRTRKYSIREMPGFTIE